MRFFALQRGELRRGPGRVPTRQEPAAAADDALSQGAAQPGPLRRRDQQEPLEDGVEQEGVL